MSSYSFSSFDIKPFQSLWVLVFGPERNVGDDPPFLCSKDLIKLDRHVAVTKSTLVNFGSREPTFQIYLVNILVVPAR